jgi:hypothetical protein
MAVFKSDVLVQDAGARSLGEGKAYVHLPRGLDAAQDASGTVSLRRWEWEPTADGPSTLLLQDGRRLAIAVSRDVLSDCSRKRILRFQATWPPVAD